MPSSHRNWCRIFAPTTRMIIRLVLRYDFRIKKHTVKDTFGSNWRYPSADRWDTQAAAMTRWLWTIYKHGCGSGCVEYNIIIDVIVLQVWNTGCIIHIMSRSRVFVFIVLIKKINKKKIYGFTKFAQVDVRKTVLNSV